MANSRQWYAHSNYVVSAAAPTAVKDMVRQCAWFLKANLLQQISSFVNRGPEGAAPSTAAWVCEGSGSSVAAGMDGTDRWGSTYDPSKLLYASEAAGGNTASWICLRSPAAIGPVWLTLMLNSGYDQAASVILSYAKPTWSTVGALPTFTLAAGIANEGILASTTTAALRWHFSTDANGDFWMLGSRDGDGYVMSCIGVQKLINLRASSDAYPTVLVASGADSPGSMRDDRTSYSFFRTTGTGQVFGLTYSGVASRMSCLVYDCDSNLSFLNKIGPAGFNFDGQLDSYACTVFNGSSAPYGIKGDFPDVRAICSVLSSGARNPATGNIDQVVVGSTLLPFTVVPNL